MTTSQKMQQMTAQTMQQSKDQVAIPKTQEFRELLYQPKQTAAFEKILGKEKTAVFQQTIMNVVLMPQNRALRECTANSILRSCMACAVTGLTIDPAFGQAAIVPYKDTATFMPMRNGLVKLARQSGLISDVRTVKIYEGDVEYYDPITGEIFFNRERAMDRLKGEPKDQIAFGYYGVILFKDGGKHSVYRSISELNEHGRKYSKMYGRKDKYGNYMSLWQTNESAMHEKTLVRQLVLKEGAIDQYMDSRLYTALKFDGATPDNDDILNAKPEYPEVEEAEATIVEEGGENVR